MRRSIREILLDPELWEVGGEWWYHVNRLMPQAMRHDYKKKFLNQEEALWWLIEMKKGVGTPYKCRRCPFWHLSRRT